MFDYTLLILATGLMIHFVASSVQLKRPASFFSKVNISFLLLEVTRHFPPQAFNFMEG